MWCILLTFFSKNVHIYVQKKTLLGIVAGGERTWRGFDVTAPADYASSNRLEGLRGSGSSKTGIRPQLDFPIP